MSESLAYRIIKWVEMHSTGEQRRLRGRKVLMPTSVKSEGLQYLMESSEGRSAFTVYVLLSEFAGTLPDAIGPGWSPALAGILFDDRGPFDAKRLARKLPLTEKVIGAALPLLISPAVGWVDQVKCPAPSGYRPDLDDDENPDDSRRSSGTSPEDSRNNSGPRPRTRPPAAAAAAALNSSAYEDAAAAAAAPGLASIARRIGLGDLVPSLNDRFPELDAAGLLAHWHQVHGDAGLKNKTGALRSRFTGTRHWPTPILTPAALIAAAQHQPAVIVAVGLGGARFELAGRKLGSNSNGFHVDDKLAIPSNRIAEIEIE